MKTLYAITHISDKLGLRQLTFANQGRNHYHSRKDALSAFKGYKSALAAGGILSPAEAATLTVRAVQCYDHGDAVGIYFDGPKLEVKKSTFEGGTCFEIGFAKSDPTR